MSVTRRELLKAGLSATACAGLGGLNPIVAEAGTATNGPEEGVRERALFVLDQNGVIARSYCSPVAVNPGAEGILKLL